MDRSKLLGLMRYWLFGTFVIVFTATTLYIGLFSRPDWTAALNAGLPIWGITALLCIAWYYVYKWYIGRKS